ncbi:MAG TPA: hypothetical protein VHY08_07510 [Bacillota bacterium]|nr:hypothetical protein [Bacillota bacterium]
MDHENNSLPGIRKKKIFPAVCDYLRKLNPYPSQNFNDVYVDFIKQQLNYSSFDTTRLSKWIQGNKSDLLKNPVYIDIMIQFIQDTFQTANINPETIATRIRAEYQNNTDAFYHFVKRYEKLYFKKEYIQYLIDLIREETIEYNQAINSETMTVNSTFDSNQNTESFIRFLIRRRVFLFITGIILIGITFYAIFIAPETGAKPSPQIQSGISPKDEKGDSSPQKVLLYEQLPQEGQLIIPKGFYFQVKPNMRGNAREFKTGDSLGDIIYFSAGVAKARADLYQKDLIDFPTVIWANSEERYQKNILILREYPENNTIENIAEPMILYSKEHIIMFEYNMD